MKFRNIKANIIEDVTDKTVIEQMKAYPEVYVPYEEAKKPAKEAKTVKAEDKKDDAEKPEASEAKK